MYNNKKTRVGEFLTEEAHPATNISPHAIGQATTAAAHLVIEMMLKKQTKIKTGYFRLSGERSRTLRSYQLKVKLKTNKTLSQCDIVSLSPSSGGIEK